MKHGCKEVVTAYRVGQITLDYYIKDYVNVISPVISYGEPLATWLLVQTFSQVVNMSALSCNSFKLVF